MEVIVENYVISIIKIVVLFDYFGQSENDQYIIDKFNQNQYFL
jgi:hypothetical protein